MFWNKNDNQTLLIKSVLEFSGATAWHNSVPLSGNDLIGKVVVLHFWSALEVTSLAAIPFLSALSAHYGNSVVVIGIYCPEMSVEADHKFLHDCIHRLGINYAIAVDGNGSLKIRYSADTVPQMMVVDARGGLKFKQTDFNLNEIEDVVRNLLVSIHREVPDEKNNAPAFFPSFTQSNSIYFGGSTNDSLGSTEVVHSGAPTYFTSVKFPCDGMFYLEGFWEIDKYGITACASDATITFLVRAKDVYVAADRESPSYMSMEINDRVPQLENFGMSVSKEAQPQALIPLKGKRVYHALTGLASDKYNKIVIRASHAGVRVFSVDMTS